MKEKSYTGLFYALIAYFIWGTSVIYWKSLSSVPPFEILMHRVIWSFLFLLPIVIKLKQWNEFISTLKNIKTLLILLVTTTIIAINWFIFIWAVNNKYILQASLGYYINPLFNVLFGMIFLKERFRPLQIIALLFAITGVIYQTIQCESFPWISLGLALTFSLYALIRKVANVNALIGLTVETLLLSVPAGIYLIFLNSSGIGSFLNINLKTDFLIICSALVTGLPLLLFNVSVKSLKLSTIGFLQYIAPTCTFFIAIFVYLEPLSKAKLISFIFIWIALFIYSIDGFNRKSN